MSKCGDIKYENLEWCDGEMSLPGIRPKVYATSKRNIVKFPTLPKTFTTALGEIATYDGDFELAQDAVWYEIGVVDFRSGVTSESQGTRPSKSFLNTGTFVHAGTDCNATGFARQANNDDLVYLFQEKGGRFRVIGNEMYQTDTAPAQDLGTEATSEKGTTFVATVTDVCPAPFYTGEVLTADGDANA